MPRTEIARPCTAADVAAVSSELKFSWGPPYGGQEDLPWPFMGQALGFEPHGVVVADQDWADLPALSEGTAYRYIVVHDGDKWVLRWGMTSADVLRLHREAGNADEPLRARRAREELGSGLGTHRLMCSAGEVARGRASGHPVGGGYIVRVEDGRVVVD